MTTWFRRWLAGALRHQHAPLPTDDHDDDDDVLRSALEPPSSSRPWGENGVRPSGYSPRPQRNRGPEQSLSHNSPMPRNNVQSFEDEQAQIDLAIRNSLQEENLRQDISNDDHQLRLALEISKKEAEAAGIEVTPGPEPSQPLQLPDLLSFDDSPPPPPAAVFSSSLPSALPTLHTEDSTSQESNAVNNFDEISSKEEQLALDEAIARSLQEEFNSMAINDSHISRNNVTLNNSNDYQNANRGVYDNRFYDFTNGTPSAPPFTSVNDSFRFIQPMINCAGCNKPVNPLKFLSCLGKNWHENCFLCHFCNKPICEPQFKVEGDIPYHSSCHKRLFHPKCAVCKNYIPGSPDGVIRITTFPPWTEKYCPFHTSDGTVRCTGCKRLEPRGEEYVDLQDGRKLCLECMDSAIFSAEECYPLFAEIHSFFRSMGLFIKQEIPLLCVETQALNSALEGEASIHHHQAETRGVCLTEERTISSVVGTRNRSGRVTIKQGPVFLQRHSEVTAIIVLYALPRLTTGCILAHELMHAWIKLDGGFPALSGEIEEGICQVMSILWLQRCQGLMNCDNDGASSAAGTSDSVSMSFYEKQLLEYELYIIREDASPVYGDGFRAAFSAVQKIGLKSTLDHIRLTGSLP